MYHCLVGVYGKSLFYAVKGRLPWSRGLRKKNMIIEFQDTMFFLVSTRLKESFRKSLEEMSKWGDDAQEGDSQEEAKGASKLADQRVDGKYQDLVKYEIMKSRREKKQDLLLLHDVRGDKVEHELVWRQQVHRGWLANQREVLVRARHLGGVNYIWGFWKGYFIFWVQF